MGHPWRPGTRHTSSGENGGIVLFDTGRIVFDADKNPTFIAGRHPQFLGSTFCAALAP
jgi:hypothetical protein